MKKEEKIGSNKKLTIDEIDLCVKQVINCIDGINPNMLLNDKKKIALKTYYHFNEIIKLEKNV